MDNRRSVALVMAAVAAILVMLAGKACTSDTSNNSRKRRSSASNSALATLENYGYNNQKPESPPDGYIDAEEEQTQGDQEVPDENVKIEQVTNLFGNVVSTEIVTLEPKEEKESEAPVQPQPTTKGSLFDDYNSEDDENSLMSGYKHKKKKKSSSDEPATIPVGTVDPNATLPADWVIEVR